jgi:glycosyltransferase involved in cell wall biosynthesis
MIPQLSNKIIEVHVPVLNERDSLVRLVNSFESQTFKRFVVIFHDNASDDGTSELIESLTSTNERYQHIRYQTRGNWWVQFGRILAFPKHAHYVSLRSSNDYIFPNYYGEVFEVLEMNPHCALAYSHGYELPVNSQVALYNQAARIDTREMDSKESLQHTVRTFTQPFSFWGTYRTNVFNRITRIECYGQDHVQVAEASTYGSIIPTASPLDMLINRERRLSGIEQKLGLSPLWTAYHPQVSRGTLPNSQTINPDIFAPFTSMLLGHIKMLLSRYQAQTESTQMVNAMTSSFKSRFAPFIELEESLLRHKYSDYNELITNTLLGRKHPIDAHLITDFFNSGSYAELLLASRLIHG